MFKQNMICLGLAALAMASPANSQQSPQNSTGQPLRIGASASLTGKAYSVQGNYVREGYLLCQKHVNAQGGVLGRPIEFVIYDDESDGKKAALLYEKRRRNNSDSFRLLCVVAAPEWVFTRSA